MTPELKKIYDSLPKYRYLTPRVDRWRDVDEFAFSNKGKIEFILPCWKHREWAYETIDSESFNMDYKRDYIVLGNFLREYDVGRRPYTEEELFSISWWKLFREICPIKFHSTISPESLCLYGEFYYPLTKSKIESLGGESEIIKQLDKGCFWWG